ncbi:MULTISPECIES: hypothetical protein [unclassified Paenibacillus]|uniref:hypothetical protein n=1 Tax=unclassified Paenibacillus TaxID=185978 RepID=UPI001C128BE4|nr:MULTISPECIES: hypothetical protein [unclassified Paenibacillus]MBU5443157.1 hypothetical protein [Paenibacillus sp. MSJ-34]CAH0121169.1 hypothetical protein PAE9249_03695 [Paenibacillus sp. CECT 9249]
MRKILWIGACDHSELILGLCKIIAAANRSVLLVDGTSDRQTLRIVPAGSKRERLVEFDRFDIAYGFATWNEALDMRREDEQPNYDYVFVMTDQDRFIAGHAGGSFDRHVLVTSLEKECTVRNAETLRRWLAGGGQTATLTRVFYQFVECSVDEEYVERMTDDLPVVWSEHVYYIPFDEKDYETKIDNQYAGMLDIRPLSGEYKRTLRRLAMDMTDLDRKAIKRAFHQAQKGGL